jgi:8-oxo-dGTP diphosphatase
VTPLVLIEPLRLHSTIAGEVLGKDTFRRRVIGQLEEIGEFQQGVVGKSAKLFRRKPDNQRGR